MKKSEKVIVGLSIALILGAVAYGLNGIDVNGEYDKQVHQSVVELKNDADRMLDDAFELIELQNECGLTDGEMDQIIYEAITTDVLQ